MGKGSMKYSLALDALAYSGGDYICGSVSLFDIDESVSSCVIKLCYIVADTAEAAEATDIDVTAGNVVVLDTWALQTPVSGSSTLIPFSLQVPSSAPCSTVFTPTFTPPEGMARLPAPSLQYLVLMSLGSGRETIKDKVMSSVYVLPPLTGAPPVTA
ncbi:hypothetical protein KIPB_013209, partial [Kipferlia bialata]|eukprot:g13209.t1